MRRAFFLLLVACAALGTASPAAALEARITEMRVAGGSLFAAIELKDLFPAKFQNILEGGEAIHLRLQLELWETRPVWDKLVQPAAITVFRIVLDPSNRQVRVADRYGEISAQPAWQEPLSVRVDLGRPDALRDGTNYYVRALATIGTIAEKESTTAGNVVFGDDDSSVSLAAMGKMLFHAVLQVNEYLQSISTEARTRRVTGRELKAGTKLQ
jgi:hypothetical protein